MQSSGAFIVLESTQPLVASVASHLLERLKTSGHQAALVEFPRRSHQSSYFVRQLRQGAYGAPGSVSPYTEALFAILDLFDASHKIQQEFRQGKIVIAHNFTGSVMAQQGTRFASSEERRSFYIWLDNIASTMLHIPRPMQSFVLAGGPNPDPLLELCQLFPADFKLLDITRGNKPLSDQSVTDLVWESIQPLLPAPADATAEPTKVQPFTGLQMPSGQYAAPSNLKGESLKLYQNSVTSLLASHQALHIAANEYAKLNLTQSDTPKLQAAVDQTLPIAAIPGLQLPGINPSDLSGAYGQQEYPVRLTRVWPRNELDLLPNLLYVDTHLSLDELSEDISSWPYTKKSQAFLEKLNLPAALRLAQYQWDILSSFQAMQAAENGNYTSNITHQALTPRYGYAVPEIIESAGLSELLEDCFDQSLKFHSQLVAAGHDYAAQYVTLTGHKIRWSCNQDASHIRDMLAADDPVLATISSSIHSRINTLHPLITQFIISSSSS